MHVTVNNESNGSTIKRKTTKIHVETVKIPVKTVKIPVKTIKTQKIKINKI